MTRMIAAAEFKAACREMLDALEDGSVDADLVDAQSDALVDAAVQRPAMGPENSLLGSMRGSILWMADDLVDPVDPDWETQWEANNPPELCR